MPMVTTLKFDYFVSSSSITGQCKTKGCVSISKEDDGSNQRETQEIFIEEITEFELLDLLQIMIRVRGIGLGGDRKLIWAAFNPVDEEHWVKKTLIEIESQIGEDLAEFKIRNLHSTYLDNKFVGKNYVANLNKVRQLDPNYYRIYGLGEWGSIKPDAPFFYKFDYEKNVNAHRKKYGREVKYNPLLPVYLAFDFNKSNSCIVSQKDWGRRYFTYLEEINEPVGFDLKAVVTRVVQTYGTTYYNVTGDPSGNGASAFTQDNQAAYSLMKGYFKDLGCEHFADFSAVTRSPLHYLPSKAISNAIFLEEEEVYFHPSMTKTVKDLTQMRQSKDGGLDKLFCDKNNFGHLGDCVRYDQAFHFYNVWSNYGYQMKNILG